MFIKCSKQSFNNLKKFNVLYKHKLGTKKLHFNGSIFSSCWSSKSRDLLALEVLKIISPLAGKLSYLVWIFLIGSEFPVCRVLGFSNNFSQNEVPDREFSMLEFLVVHLCQLFMIISHPY